jgi:hypothetical protein
MKLFLIIQTLSIDRFGTYLTAANRDQDRALRLYIWNAQMGEAFHTPIQTVEVALRNGVNKALTAKFGADWWREPAFLRLIDRERQLDLQTVQKRINNRQLSMVTGQIVAGLSFGFWVGMLQPRYNPEIWGAHLRKSFPNLPATESRHSLFKTASAVAGLRNRISHHEPIFKRNLSDDFSTVMRMLKWICPATHDWIRPHCRVPELLRKKP